MSAGPADKADARLIRGQIFIGRQATLAGALSIVSRRSIVVTASRKENATACTEIARAISSDTASLVRDPQTRPICAPEERAVGYVVPKSGHAPVNWC